MNVEIINVGTELLLGEIVNTNATLLQKVCKNLGFNVYFQTVVGDNPERLLDCLKIAFERGADCVMTTGGLGPTTDDLTKELSAQYLGLEMIRNEEEAEKVRKKCFYLSRGHISENNYKQANFPKEAYILENDMGTANACVMIKDEKMIINLPGPPKELGYVVEHSLIPFLSQYKQDTLFTYEYTTMLLGESRIDEILSDLIYHQSDVSIALYAGEQTVRIRLAVKATSKQEAHLLMKDIQVEIERRIGDYILKEKDLQDALIKTNVPIQFLYKSEFHFQDEFLQALLSNRPQVKITIQSRQEELGEVLMVNFNDDYHFEIPTFVKASYSYQRVEARLVAQLYHYIMSKKDK